MGYPVCSHPLRDIPPVVILLGISRLWPGCGGISRLWPGYGEISRLWLGYGDILTVARQWRDIPPVARLWRDIPPVARLWRDIPPMAMLWRDIPAGRQLEDDRTKPRLHLPGHQVSSEDLAPSAAAVLGPGKETSGVGCHPCVWVSLHA